MPICMYFIKWLEDKFSLEWVGSVFIHSILQYVAVTKMFLQFLLLEEQVQ